MTLGTAQNPKNYEDLPEHAELGKYRVKCDGDVITELTDFSSAKEIIEEQLAGMSRIYNIVEWKWETVSPGIQEDVNGNLTFTAGIQYLHPVLRSDNDAEAFIFADLDLWAVLLVADFAR